MVTVVERAGGGHVPITGASMRLVSLMHMHACSPASALHEQALRLPY